MGEVIGVWASSLILVFIFKGVCWVVGSEVFKVVTILMEVGVVELDLKNENVHKINLKKLK